MILGLKFCIFHVLVVIDHFNITKHLGNYNQLINFVFKAIYYSTSFWIY